MGDSWKRSSSFTIWRLRQQRWKINAGYWTLNTGYEKRNTEFEFLYADELYWILFPTCKSGIMGVDSSLRDRGVLQGLPRLNLLLQTIVNLVVGHLSCLSRRKFKCFHIFSKHSLTDKRLRASCFTATNWTKLTDMISSCLFCQLLKIQGVEGYSWLDREIPTKTNLLAGISLSKSPNSEYLFNP